MRTVLRSKTKQPGSPVSTQHPYPAPIGGWNARDSLALMKSTDAITLDNFFPRASFVEIRGGSKEFTSGSGVDILCEDGTLLTTESNDDLATEDTLATMVGNIKTLMAYNAQNGTGNRLIAVTNQFVYDITTGGPVAGSVATRTDGKHQWLMFGDGTNQWLIACNGQDNTLYFDGTTWLAVTDSTSPALIGVPSNELIAPIKHKGRLFFLRKNSLVLYYLPAGAAGGTFLPFDVSADCKRGGFLMAGASWTKDAGDGMDDLLVLITSEGEALVYQGNNPSSASNWALIGTFYIGRPIGRRCLSQYGGELLVITENGAFQISAALLTSAVTIQTALSDKIVRAFTEAAHIYGGNFGWEATLFPAQQALIVNVPLQEDGRHHQYVMNTQTKAWSRFTGWDAETFVVFQKDLYFAKGNIVYLAWDGATSDPNGSAIEWYGKQAFSQFGYAGMKRPGLFRPIFVANGSVNYTSAIDTDFEETNIRGGSIQSAVTDLPLWGERPWGTHNWGGGSTTLKEWGTTATTPGSWLSGKVRGATGNSKLQWMASEMFFEKGMGL